MSNFPRAVAIVDDDVAVLDALKFLLELSGYRVNIYGSAAAFIEDHERQPTCLILDQHMPQMTGLELAAYLQKQGKAIPTLLITGASAPSIIARAAQFGIKKVLEKPPTEEDLLRFVEVHTVRFS